MSRYPVAIRDRTRPGHLRLRDGSEPVKLRVCRGCGRVHSAAPPVCAAAAAA